jgi:type II secretory pathway component PulM
LKARQLYIKDPLSNRIRLTQAGLDKYAARFARVGYQASKIKTIEALKDAINASFDHDMAKLASTARGGNADLDEVLSGLPGWD